MSFPKLLEVALTGTLRQEPPAAFESDTLLSAESRVLRGASYEGVRRLAGRAVERIHEHVPTEPARPEVLAEVPAAAAARLPEILETWPQLLPEWLHLAA